MADIRKGESFGGLQLIVSVYGSPGVATISREVEKNGSSKDRGCLTKINSAYSE